MGTQVILSAGDMEKVLEKLAKAVLERHGQSRDVVLLGVQRRGADLAERLKKIVSSHLKRDVPLGKIDINLYRDDWTSLNGHPQLNRTEIPFEIDDKIVVLVDDVLFTGRTIRAALEAILDFGRPSRVELLVLVDRGHRELPIQADYTGHTVETAKDEHVDVYVKERDGKDHVVLSGTKARK